MNVEKSVKMTADEFIAWGLRQDSGRYELEKGEVLKMSPERTRHVRAKSRLWRLLDDAIATAGLGAEVFADGLAVQVDERTVYEPDALVRTGPRLGDDDVKTSDPVIVVEVLSPSTERRDSVTKLAGYFRLGSVRHYLILDPEEAAIVHHFRDDGGAIRTEIATEGLLRLDSPGLDLDLDALFSGLRSSGS